MDILSSIFGAIYGLLNETLGHQIANMFNGLLWTLGVYHD